MVPLRQYGRTAMSTVSELRVDHLLFTVPDLHGGCDLVEDMLGVRPTLGGRHPGLGTANALVGLGPDTYLEVIAPDPDITRDEPLVFLGTDFSRPQLSSWVAKAKLVGGQSDLPEVFGSVTTGRRENPDGAVLTWVYSDPFQPRFGGVVPFLIDWGDTPHPASALDQRCSLIELRLEHPQPSIVAAALDGYGGAFPLRLGARPRISARIASPNGDVEIS